MKMQLLGLILVGMILLAGCAQTQPQPQNQVVGNDKDEHGCIASAGYSWCEEKQKCLRVWEENCTAEVAPECVTVADCGLGAASCVNGVCSQYDEHGCVPDGGYTWCEEKQKCIRAWEEECAVQETGVECTTVADCGEGAASCVNGKCSQYDEHGCVPDGGYSWCEALQQCIRPWETNCTSTESAIDAKARSFCGQENIEKVYVCGEYIRTVAALIGGGSSIYDASGNKLSDCPMVNPEYFSEICKKVILESNCAEQEIC